MQQYRFLALPLTLILIAGLAYGLSLSAQNNNQQTAAVTPWDGLSAADYQIAAAAIKQAQGEDVMFIRISLQQPDKQKALAWQPGQIAERAAEITFLKDGKPYLAQVSLTDNSAATIAEIRGGHPMYSSQGELTPLVLGLSEQPEMVSVMAERGIGEGEFLCLPRTVGRYFSDRVNVRRDRIVRLDCFYIKGQSGLGILPSTNLYARPIEGIGILYNVSQQRIVSIEDSATPGQVPPHDVTTGEFHEGAMKHRPALKPVTTARPQGVNFTVKGSAIDWQGWHFHLRFDPRQGTVLNRIGHKTEAGLRDVAYEIAMSEMFVPYFDNDPNWYYRAYFDMGEYGFGNMSTPLLGADCPAGAVFQNVTLHLPDGSPYEAENRICIFEHDPGYPAWRHYEPVYEGVPGMDIHQSRRATELVVRMVATIGNYDYFQDYVFGQDGRLRIRLISTGLDAVKGVMSKTLADPTAAADTKTGALIAPHRLAVNHDHYFSYRIDMDIDGPSNNFDRLKIRPTKQPANAPRSGIWGIVPQRVATEKQARTKMSADRPALLVFSSTEKKNAMGYPSAYQLMMPNVKPLVSQFDETIKRGYFVQNNLWVTRFKRNEIFASGLAINQSVPYLGLPEYIADNEPIAGEDIVAWATMGFHHVPMAEDWPVMPSKVDEIVLKPRNYFDRNPAIDLRP